MSDLFDQESGFFKTKTVVSAVPAKPKKWRKPILVMLLVVTYAISCVMMALAGVGARLPVFDYAAPMVVVFLVLVAILIVVFDPS